MIKSAEIRNFRCYSSAKLEDCRRINLIVGDNGSGKTSLLESIFLAAGGSVEIAFRLRQLRGYEAGISATSNEIDDALWRDLFYKFNKMSEVSVSLLGSEFRNRRMSIKFAEANSVTHTINKKSKFDANVEQSPILFDWLGPSGRRVTVRPTIKDGKVNLPTVLPLPEETFFFAAGQNYSANETAKRFSDLSKTFKDFEVTRRFKEHFTMIEDLSIELIAGMPMVCAKIEGMPEKVPLNLISSGMSKLASIIFAMSSKKGSVVLVDEIENGIHYRKFPVMWESFLDFCKMTDSQLFISTHSFECISAAAAVAERHPDDFCVIHTNGKGEIRQFGGASFAKAIEQEIEIR